MRRVLASSLALLLVTTAPGTSLAGSLLGNSDSGANPPEAIDDVVDNCRDVGNGDQTDSDLDGCGNACDADYDNNGVVGGSDFSRLRCCFGKASTATPAPPCEQKTCEPVDSDNNAKIGSGDFSTLRNGFGKKAGVSLSPLRKPALCRDF